MGNSFLGQKNIRPRWGFAFPDTLNARDPSGDSIFWINKHQTPVGFCISRHPESPRPRRGFHFLNKKTPDPSGVLHFPTPWKSKTPVGIPFFRQKNTRPRWGFAFPDTLKVQDTSCIFYFFNKKMPATPCSLLSRTPWMSKTHPVSSIFLTKKCQLHPVVYYLRHTECPRHTLYLLFFNKKMPTTPCSLLSQTPWMSKTHPVSSIFLTKNTNYTLWFAFPDTLNVQFWKIPAVVFGGGILFLSGLDCSFGFEIRKNKENINSI